jgi:hypothetical protein
MGIIIFLYPIASIGIGCTFDKYKLVFAGVLVKETLSITVPIRQFWRITE